MSKNHTILLFNSPVEMGLRITCLLYSLFPAKLTLDRIVMLDLLLINSERFGGPDSIHPPSVFTLTELFIQRDNANRALSLLQRKGLACLSHGPSGLTYTAGPRTPGFLNSVEAPHAIQLQDRANWVAEFTIQLTTDELRNRALAEIKSIPTRFKMDSILREPQHEQ